LPFRSSSHRAVCAADSRRLGRPIHARPVRIRRAPLALAVALACALAAGQSAADSSPRKLGRGLANMTTGVIVLPAKVIETTRDHGPFVGATWGLVKGVGWVVATETIGVFELVTCPFELPPDFKPILQPEFPWQHYQDPAKRATEAKPAKRKSVFTRDH
jgi:putative exosortase-associated protein (TIGR04073 family)